MLCTLTYNTFSVILFLSLLAPTLCACCVINPGKWHLSACFTKKIKSLASVKSRRMFTSYCSVLLFTPSHTASNSVFMEIALCLWLMLLQKRFVFPSHKEQWTAFVLYIVFTVQLCRLNHSPNLLSLSLSSFQVIPSLLLIYVLVRMLTQAVVGQRAITRRELLQIFMELVYMKQCHPSTVIMNKLDLTARL